MKKDKLFKKWNRYYNLNVFFAIFPAIATIAMLYMWACGMINLEMFLITLFVIISISIMSLAIISNKIAHITTSKENLNSFLQIAVDKYKSMANDGIWSKRKLNKQMTFALNLKTLLNQFDNTKNKYIKPLRDFIENKGYLKNESEFISLCNKCLIENSQNKIDEVDKDKSSNTKLIRRFVLTNIKIVVFYAMIFALFITIIIAYLGDIYNIFPTLANFVMKHKESIETANTIVFDIAAILILYFEIKQEDI